MASVSIVFPKVRVPHWGITKLTATESVRALTEALYDSTEIEWMVGGIDVSLNDDTQKGFKEEWQPQVYAVAMVSDSSALGPNLRSKFKRTKKVCRPVQIKPCDGTAKAISYAYKPEFVRRVAYHGTITSNGERRRCWMTRKFSLRPFDHADLMEWLDSVGLAHRLYLFRLQMAKASNGVGLEKVKLLE